MGCPRCPQTAVACTPAHMRTRSCPVWGAEHGVPGRARTPHSSWMVDPTCPTQMFAERRGYGRVQLLRLLSQSPSQPGTGNRACGRHTCRLVQVFVMRLIRWLAPSAPPANLGRAMRPPCTWTGSCRTASKQRLTAASSSATADISTPAWRSALRCIAARLTMLWNACVAQAPASTSNHWQDAWPSTYKVCLPKKNSSRAR